MDSTTKTFIFKEASVFSPSLGSAGTMTTFSSPKSSFQTPNSLALKNSFLKKPPLKSGTIQPVKPIVFKQKPTIVFPVQSPSGLNQHHIRPHFRSTHDFSDASKENDEKSKENTRDVSSQNQKLSTKTDIDRSGESPQNNSAFGKSFVLKKHTTRSSSDIKKSLVLPTKTQNGSLTPSFAVSQTPKILPNDPNPHLKGTSSNASFKKLQEAKTNDHHEAHKNTLKSGSKEDLPGETREVNNEGNIKNNTSLIEKDSSPADSSFKTNMIIQKKKLKMKITNVAVKSKAGCSGRRVQKTNQDSFINLPQFIESRGIGLFGILDGHGTFGHHVSQFVKTSLPRNIEEIIQKMPNGSLSDLQITEALTQAFTDTLEELKKTSIDCYVSGTTCNLCLVYKNKVFCANAGDSRALLLRSKAPKHKQFEAITMSEDHKVDLEKEKMRILAAGGRVEPYKGTH